jgi:glycosyltransferase involved in cell wall biosynthesis
MSCGSVGRTVVVSANSSWALTNYRLGLLRALQDAGYSLVAAVPDDAHASHLRDAGIETRTIRIARHGKSPVADLKLLYCYVDLLRRLKPAVFLGFTIKPNIYGALAGQFAGVPVINNITGLGMVFTRAGPLRALVRALYRIAFRRSNRIFFQNPESRDLFLSAKMVRASQASLLPGSGIDLDWFSPVPGKTAAEAGLTFLLPARMIWQKGIGEFCEAARRMRIDHPGVRFQLAGPTEPEAHEGAISARQIDQWRAENVDYLGSVDDIRPTFEAADCIVLPSYYPEGVPRSLIEAAAMAKPIITTDTPGCRDVVEAGVTGYFCHERSVESLTAAMLEMIERSADERAEMGRRARMKIEREFDERLVIEAYLEAIDAIVS